MELTTPERSVLLMVATLHCQGYERLRIAPGMGPSGLYWRCSIAPAGLFHGRSAMLSHWDGAVAHYTSGQGRAYFDWPDAGGDAPEGLADKFRQRFPAILQAGRGRDPAYAAWYQELLHLTQAGHLPIAYADWDLPDGCLSTVNGCNPPIIIPLPPPGEG